MIINLVEIVYKLVYERIHNLRNEHELDLNCHTQPSLAKKKKKGFYTTFSIGL